LSGNQQTKYASLRASHLDVQPNTDTLIQQHSDGIWLALAIGNSRLHWAQFGGDRLEFAWDTPHLSATAVRSLIASQFNFQGEQLGDRPKFDHRPPLWIASVVPEQTHHWHIDPEAIFLTADQIPLHDLYPTLGIDRALAAWGAVVILSSPVLVIDAGTALTFTGIDDTHHLVGGAILPGLRLQFQSLKQSTAALPAVPLPSASATNPDVFSLPSRWALATPEAIASGILHTVLAGLRDFIQAWWQQFPGSAVVLTGGDGDRLHRYLQQQSPVLATNLTVNPHLIFEGMRAVRAAKQRSRA